MKKLISLFIAIVMIASAAAAAIPVSAVKTGFPDVEDDRWSAASVKYAVESGYMKGVGGGLFDPEGPLTRAMVATVLWRREGEPKPAAPSGFTDVPANEWYTDAVAWAKEAGVVNGTSEVTFEPDAFITREQLGTMLFRFSSNAPVSVPERADLSPFADDETVSEWANEPLEWAVESNLLKGTDGNRLDPGGFATREQFAAIIERYDGTFKLAYNRPVVRSHYTEPEYPLVTDADFYVSTAGSDENDGSFDHPFVSFEKAVEAVRGVPKTAEKGSVRVAFMAGRYSPVHLDLTEADSGTPECPVIYCKYGDGDVVFDNGATIPESAFEELTDEEKAMFSEKHAVNIRKVDLNAFYDEIPEYDDFELYGDGDLMNVAQYPNKYEDGSDHFLSSGRTYDDASLLITNSVLARRIAKYTAEEIAQMRIFGYIIRGYRKDGFRVATFDPDTGILTVANPETSEFGRMREGWQGVDGQGIELCVLNIPYELDSQNEYWVDRSTGTLYVYLPEGDYRIPGGKGEKLLRGDPYDAGDGLPPVPEYVVIDARNVGYITLLGLDFENAAGAFIFGFKTSGLTIDRCSFSYSTGRNHALFEYSLDGVPMDLSIINSEFDYSVGCGVYIMDVSNGPNRYTDISNVKVDNCYFGHTNLAYDVEGACNLFKCTKGVISHCDFVECHRYAVQFDYSCDVVVEYNNFDSAMTNSEDGGVIRTALGMDSNAIIRYNLVNTVPDGSVGRFAQYSDLVDCGSTDCNNLFYDAGPIVYADGGRDNAAIDNVFIGGGIDVGSLVPGILEAGDAARGEFPINMHLGNWSRILNYCDTVPGYREELEKRRPGASTFSFDFNNPDDPNFFLAPVTTVRGNAFINGDSAVRAGAKSPEFLILEDNTAYGYDENPFFVNPTIGDYRVREGVDLDLPFELIGRY